MADSNAEFQEVLLGIGFGGITDVKIGPDGLLYILSFGFGEIFVISGQSTPFDFDGDSSTVVGSRMCFGLQTAVAWGGAPQDIPLN